eukprot:CAMPEP_0119374918 /NCGR_PEP_ID=MMETSP1334-20130426/33424_1 /TAXON_ID=127549 /ORGANISM="Calcidiscus leptoporus, Strain RCC1130" /LENGTH=51 /DNA_ID=CAMNT_0007393117 /DNA_START=103 /DNA_END=255 /DNA_ORIENTATION=-
MAHAQKRSPRCGVAVQRSAAATARHRNCAEPFALVVSDTSKALVPARDDLP